MEWGHELAQQSDTPCVFTNKEFLSVQTMPLAIPEKLWLKFAFVSQELLILLQTAPGSGDPSPMPASSARVMTLGVASLGLSSSCRFLSDCRMCCCFPPQPHPVWKET